MPFFSFFLESMRLHRRVPTAAMAASSSPSTPPVLRRRRVEFPSKEKGVNLVGELVWPSTPPTSLPSSSPSKTLPVSVLAHGLADDRDSFVLPLLAQELAVRVGVASLRFDFRGSGESGGAFKFGNAATPDGDPLDLEAAVEFLGSFRGGGGDGSDGGGSDVTFEVAALLGHSKAGSAVVSYAARRGGKGSKEEGEKKKNGTVTGGADNDADEDETDPLFVPMIINVAGRFDHADPLAITARFGDNIFEALKEAGEEGVPFTWRVGSRLRTPEKEDGGSGGSAGSDGDGDAKKQKKQKKTLEWRLTAADLEDRLTTDMGALCGRLPARTRLLCVHGAEDATVPPSAAERYREAAAPRLLSPPRVVMVEGADHNFTDAEKASELVDAVVEFISEGL